MNKKILAIMIAAALLQGCASYRQLESTRKEAVAEQQRAREMMSDLRTRTPVVKESSRQWINPRPVMDKNTGKTVPGCPIVIHTRQSITLQQVVHRHITTTTSAGGQSGNPGSSYRDTADTGTDPRTAKEEHRLLRRFLRDDDGRLAGILLNIAGILQFNRELSARHNYPSTPLTEFSLRKRGKQLHLCLCSLRFFYIPPVFIRNERRKCIVVHINKITYPPVNSLR
ncbi:TPA: hypothetical protein ACHHNX_004499 [Escherichia coli]